MDSPGTLNGYFEVVDDFFQKTFRDDCSLFLAMNTQQYSTVVDKEPLVSLTQSSSSPPAAGSATISDPLLPPTRLDSNERDSLAAARSSIALSPRMLLRHDGTALGKVKVLCDFRVPHVCACEQGLILNSEGVVTGTLRLRHLIEGLVIGGRASVNMIAAASEDVTSLTVRYRHKDFYYSTSYQRNGLGSSNLLVDTGTTFFNILAGAGFERQRLSYLEQRGDQDQVDIMYAGVGFTGVDWSIAAKLARNSDAWNTARLALFQKLSPSTIVACAYRYDLTEARAHVSLGFTQGFRLRLPSLLLPSRDAGAPQDAVPPSMSTPVKFLVACKAESSGLLAATLRGRFNNCVHWGLVAQRNLLQDGSRVRLGLTVSMEKDQSSAE